MTLPMLEMGTRGFVLTPFRVLIWFFFAPLVDTDKAIESFFGHCSLYRY